MFSSTSSSTTTELEATELENLDPRMLKKMHRLYIRKIYTISTVLLVASVAQWYISKQFPIMIHFIRTYNYVNLLLVAMTYCLMMIFVFTYNTLIQLSIKLTYACIILLAECGSVVLVRPMAEANTKEVIITSIITAVLILLSMIFSFICKVDLDRSIGYLVVWTMKYFLLTSMVLLVLIMMKKDFLNMLVSFSFMFLLTFHILIFGRTISTMSFFRQEELGALQFGVLYYCNFTSFYANALLFCANISKFMPN